MKKNTLLLIALVLLSCNSSQKATEQVQQSPKTEIGRVAFAETITESELMSHLYTYASDEFEGRETGKPGQKKAVSYIVDHYKKLGIPALKKDGQYTQNVPLSISKVPTGKIVVNGNNFLLGEDILSFSKAIANVNDIIYVGYGIEEEAYSDYADVDIRGKIVLMKFGEPKNDNGTYVLSGTDEKSIWSNMSESIGKRTETAASKGAKGVLYYDPDNFLRYKRYFDFMKSNNNGRMQLNAESDAPFLILLRDDAAKSLMPNLLKTNTASQITVDLDLLIESQDEKIDSENVAAIIKGTSKPDEYVIISSHLDHIGITGVNDINNGADDDGSGTVAMLEIAEAFKMAKKEGQGPSRSIVFLHVTGEEKGLLGSRFYTDYEPMVPLSNTITNLNIDMIGRIDPNREGDRNYVYLIGSDKLSSELHQLSEDVNASFTNIELDYTYNDENDPNRFYYRSDHYNFAKNNIPIIFYFNGTHDDYHKPTDTPDKINYDLLKNRTQLIFHTAWEVANRESAVVVDKAPPK